MTEWGRLGQMVPVSVVNDAGYGVRLHSGDHRDLSDRNLSLGVDLSNHSDSIVCEFGNSTPLPSLHRSVSDCIASVVLVCIPSQVTKTIVRPVSITMAGYQSFGTGTDESHQDEVVDECVLPSGQRHLRISGGVDPAIQYPSEPSATDTIKTRLGANPAQRRGFVVIVVGNSLPLLNDVSHVRLPCTVPWKEEWAGDRDIAFRVYSPSPWYLTGANSERKEVCA